MTKAEEAVKLAFELANDDAHGYDQANRWGPDYDCSSAIIYIWEKIGIKVKSAGAGYTGNMLPAFLSCGFTDVTDSVNRVTGNGIKAGDILLNVRNHAAMCVGQGKVLNASINEKGTITGGLTGDQTGREIAIINYYNYPWDYILRYAKDSVSTVKPETPPEMTKSIKSVLNPKTLYPVGLPILKKGDIDNVTYKGNYVERAQRLLISLRYTCGGEGADGNFGNGTFQAVKNYQADHGLIADGELGPKTYISLLGG